MKYLKICVCCLIILLICNCGYAGENKVQLLVDGEQDSWEYLFYKPKDNIAPSTLLVFLHGSGECGGNVWRAMNAQSLPLFLNEGKISPRVYILIPHSKKEGDFLTKYKSLNDFIKQFAINYEIDKIIISGHSMGANAAENLVSKFSKDYDGLISVSGRAYASLEPIISNSVPTVIVHGIKDSSKISKSTLKSFKKLFPSITLKNNRSLKKITSPYFEGVNILIFDDWNHRTTQEIFLNDFIWKWVGEI